VGRLPGVQSSSGSGVPGVVSEVPSGGGVRGGVVLCVLEVEEGVGESLVESIQEEFCSSLQ